MVPTGTDAVEMMMSRLSSVLAKRSVTESLLSLRETTVPTSSPQRFRVHGKVSICEDAQNEASERVSQK